MRSWTRACLSVLILIISNTVTLSQSKINLTEEEKGVLISIKDDGSGIPEDTRDKIFDPFFTTKKVGAGTGLGLSISYGIIENHGGSIDVKTEVGKGSEFLIFLPKDK